MLSFEWDERKNEINKAKHKVSFEEAQTVFYDERAWQSTNRSTPRRKKGSSFWV